MKINGEASIYQAEAIALERAARRMIQIQNNKNKYIRIFSDSQAVHKGLSKNKVKNQTILKKPKLHLMN